MIIYNYTLVQRMRFPIRECNNYKFNKNIAIMVHLEQKILNFVP